jgi:heat shock protein HslJ
MTDRTMTARNKSPHQTTWRLARSTIAATLLWCAAGLSVPLALSTVSGCAASGADSNSPAAEPIEKAIVGEWVATNIKGLTLPAGSRPPTLRITPDGKVSGFAGVNRYGSSLDIERLSLGEFAMAPAAATKLAGPPELMRVEMKFIEALSAAQRATVRGNTLTLSDERATTLTFTRQE